MGKRRIRVPQALWDAVRSTARTRGDTVSRVLRSSLAAYVSSHQVQSASTELWDEAELVAAERGETVSEVVRRALAAYVGRPVTTVPDTPDGELIALADTTAPD